MKGIHTLKSMNSLLALGKKLCLNQKEDEYYYILKILISQGKGDT